MIQKQKHKNKEQEHEMCKKKLKTDLYYYANIQTRTWQGYGVRSCLKLMLNILKKMKGLTYIYTPFMNLA
jgi:hypothetical protein